MVANASVEVHEVSSRKTRTVRTNGNGQFSLSGVPAGEFKVRVSSAGCKSALQEMTLQPRDRAVLGVRLDVGASTEAAEVTGANVVVEVRNEVVNRIGRDQGFGQGVAGGVMGGVIGGVEAQATAPFEGRNVPEPALVDQKAELNSATLAKDKKEDSASPSAHVRSYFPEALYINPEIITNANGAASITIPIADSITTWRMAMLASTTHGALGNATSSLKVFQDFFIDLDLPVALTQGDRVSIPVALYNYSGARGDVSLSLQPEDWFSLVDDVSEKSVSVDSSRIGGSQFTLEAKRIGKFKLTLSAHMKGEASRADIVIREIEVAPNGREQNIIFNGRLENTVQHEFNFPANSSQMPPRFSSGFILGH
jgi:hypothetical protein